MHNLIETSSFPATISVPDDGVDFRTAASLYPALQAITNRTRAVFAYLGGLTGAITLASDLLVSGAATINGLLSCRSGVSVAGDVASDTVTTALVDTNALTVSGNIAGNTIGVTGAAACASIHVSGTATVATVAASTSVNTFNFSAGGSSVFGGSVLLAAPVTVDAPVTYSGNARGIRAMAINAAAVISPQAATDFLWQSLSAATHITISSVGVQDGDELFVCNLDTSHIVSVYQADGTTLIVALLSGVGLQRSTRLKFSSALGNLWIQML